MSLVGTRPILQDELRQYELHHRARIAIKPGITGMWQVSGRSDITDFEEVVRLDTEWGVIFMYAFQLYKHRRKFRYFSDCVADSYEKVFGIILTICRIRHIIIIKRKEHSNVREHFI